MDYSLKPTTDKYINDFIKLVFEPVFRGNSIALHVVAKAGSLGLIKYLLNFPQEVSTSFNKNIKRTKFGVFDGKLISTVDDVKAFIENEINIDIKSPHTPAQQPSIKQKAFILINNAEVLISPDSPLLNLLKQIYNTHNTAFGFIFLFSRETDHLCTSEILRDIGIHQEETIPLKSNEDMSILIDKEEIWHKYKVPKDVREKIIQLSGGYSSLARSLLALANNNYKKFLKMSNKDLYNKENVKFRLLRVYDSLSEESQKQIIRLVLEKTEKLDFSNYLLKTKLISKTSKNAQLFSPLFHQFVENVIHDEPLKLKKENIAKFGINIEKVLSTQEKDTIKLLCKKSNKLVSREDIAMLIWGQNWTDKYSDWAIDQLIHSIRTKLMIDRKTLKTEKGKGYVLVINS